MVPADDGGTGPRRGAATATLIVDGANVMGSRADGWWRDRAGAMARLYRELAALAARGIPGPPSGPQAAGAQEAGARETAAREAGAREAGRWFPHIILVVEGKARAVTGLVSPDPRVELVAAAGEGDDEIARLAGAVPGRRIAITADQELRRRCLRAGAEVAGPRWLTALLP